jgi:hypothetical protein
MSKLLLILLSVLALDHGFLIRPQNFELGASRGTGTLIRGLIDCWTLKALSDDSCERLRNVLSEFLDLSDRIEKTGTSSEEMREHLKQLKTVVSAAESLDKIENDILMMEEQMQSEDPALAETGEVFFNEFTELKTLIESSLESLLASGDLDRN